jgi:hypothetical protein
VVRLRPPEQAALPGVAEEVLRKGMEEMVAEVTITRDERGALPAGAVLTLRLADDEGAPGPGSPA